MCVCVCVCEWPPGVPIYLPEAVAAEDPLEEGSAPRVNVPATLKVRTGTPTSPTGTQPNTRFTDNIDFIPTESSSEIQR